MMEKKYKVLKTFEFKLGGNIKSLVEDHVFGIDDFREFNITYLIENGLIEEYVEPKGGRFIPELDEEYYFIDWYHFGVVPCKHTDRDFNLNHIKFGNCYKTREEAQKALDKKILLTEIQDFADEYNHGWVPDWGNTDEDKWRLVYNTEDIDFDLECDSAYSPSDIHFKNPGFLKPLIEKFGDRLELLKPDSN